jgi:hypothetical protein
VNKETLSTTQGQLVLRGLVPFGVGGRRFCFVHPHDTGRCVKVLRQDEGRTIRMKRSSLIPASIRRNYDNNAHEKSFLERIYRRLGPLADQHLPRCYGMVNTDLGPGLELDLIRDHDGRISRSLRELISTGHDLEAFRSAFDELGEFLLKHFVLTRNLFDHNIAVQHRYDGSWRMYVIDGLGDPAWLPIARMFRSVGRAKIRRRIVSAWPRFERLFREGGVSQELIEKSTWGQGILAHRG